MSKELFKPGDVVECTNNIGEYFIKGKRYKVTSVEACNTGSFNRQWLGIPTPGHADSNIENGDYCYWGSSNFKAIKQRTNIIRKMYA